MIYKLLPFLLLIGIIFMIPWKFYGSKPELKVLWIEKIWENGEHNAFTDLIFYKNQFFCTFREGPDHAGGGDGHIRVLSSSDGIHWKAVTTIDKENTDLRDPMLSIAPDGKLMMNVECCTYKEQTCTRRYPCVLFSDDGLHWSKFHEVNLPGEWLWRLTWHNGTGYSAAYNAFEKPWTLNLFSTKDGLTYKPIHTFDLPLEPSETTFRFNSDDTMVALMRRKGPGLIGYAPPPYNKWTWTEITEELGGPNFLVLPNGDMWASSRKIEGEEESTVVAKMTLDSYTPIMTLASGGDTSYPGMVYRDGKLYISYYSSHEGKSMIYLAILEIKS